MALPSTNCPAPARIRGNLFVTGGHRAGMAGRSATVVTFGAPRKVTPPGAKRVRRRLTLENEADLAITHVGRVRRPLARHLDPIQRWAPRVGRSRNVWRFYDGGLARGGGPMMATNSGLPTPRRQDAYAHVHTSAAPPTGDASGRRTTKVLPLLSSLSTEMVPP